MQQRIYSMTAALLMLGITGVALSQQQTHLPQTSTGKTSVLGKSAKGKRAFSGKPDQKVIREQKCRSGAPGDLLSLTLDPHVILVGRVTRVVRVGTTPLGVSSVWLGNHTVYSVEVERYLKGTGPKTIKLRYDGGEVESVLYVVDDVAHPKVGERYLLFLQSPEKSPMVKRLGYLPVGIGGKMYRAGDADEYQLLYPQHSQVLLKEGRTYAVKDALHRNLPDWRFTSAHSAQIVGVTEAEALSATEEAIVWRPKSPKHIGN